MDKDNHWSEIVDMVNANKQQAPLEALDPERMQNIEQAVFKHIDEQLADATDVAQQGTHSAKNTAPQNDGIFGKLAEQARAAFEGLFANPAGRTAFAAVCLCALGSVLYFKTSTDSINSGQQLAMFDIPESISTESQQITSHIEARGIGAKAIIDANRSEVANAFTTGLTLADIQLINKSGASIDDYLADTNIDTFNASVETYHSNSATKNWLALGHANEVLHLSAKLALTNLETKPLHDAVAFYQTTASTVAIGSQSDNFMQNHAELVRATPETLSTPADIERIVTATSNLKILIK